MKNDIINQIQKKQVLPQIEGRTFVFGDIHGEYHKFMSHLESVQFDTNKDRVVCVGDLIDRGPDSAKMLELLKKDWFFSVMGNHELMPVVAHAGRDNFIYSNGKASVGMLNLSDWIRNGGDWFFDKKEYDLGNKATVIDSYRRLMILIPLVAEMIVKHMPLAIEFTSRSGEKVGVVHAAVPNLDWTSLEKDLSVEYLLEDEQSPVWDRKIIHDSTGVVSGIDLTCHGHTSVKEVFQAGNRIYLDTGLYHTGKIGCKEF